MFRGSLHLIIVLKSLHRVVKSISLKLKLYMICIKYTSEIYCISYVILILYIHTHLPVSVCLMCIRTIVNRLKSAKVTDKRIRVMNEIISGMRMIKMYAWEWAFHDYVKKIRKSARVKIRICIITLAFIAGRKSRLLPKLV